MSRAKECRRCRHRFKPASNRAVECDDCRRTKDCTRCGASFIASDTRHRVCDRCRLATDAKTSQCPFCMEVYISHGGGSRAEVDERQRHALAKCKPG